MRNQVKHRWLALVGVLLVGVLIGFGAGYWSEAKGKNALVAAIQGSLMPVQDQEETYTLVKPLLAYRTPEATTYGEYTALKSEIEGDIKTAGVDRVSVYFRDLDTARWIGVNQNDTYYPASLLKVPLMIAYFKQAETNPALLREEVTYGGVTLPPFDTPSQLVLGRNYTIEDLIRRMIVDSDNGAAFTLFDRVNPGVLDSVYTALGIETPGDDSSNYQISNRTYALFFRVLYNATYLSPAYSQKALELLISDEFKEGLAARLPKDMKLANKWGQHVVTDASGKNAVGVELHDCGVVYYPKHPYLLCVMTSAKEVTAAEEVIATVSKTTYDAVAARYK